jgi:UPF0176 protein
MKLHNKVNRIILKQQILSSALPRTTISFYKYWPIVNTKLFRDHLYIMFDELGVLGRVYVANEGINAQISVPTQNLEAFKNKLAEITFLDGIRLNIAVEDDGKSFIKLVIKVRPKIVADGIDDPNFNSWDYGTHLSAKAFNELTSKPETVLVDMRNHYESEVGHFENAIIPDVDTFKEELDYVVDLLGDKKNQPVVMYCTGGIRCEKASAWLKYNGFKDVYQLEGGIIKYAKDIQEQGLENKFKGKNFVFDERLGERISDEVIAHCHQCGSTWDTHVNCKNVGCNLLFLQCPSCAEKYDGCCSEECQSIYHLPIEEQKEYRKNKDSGIRIFSKGRFDKRLETKA